MEETEENSSSKNSQVKETENLYPLLPHFQIDEEVQKYEKFIEEVLQRDLQKILNSRDKIYEQISQYIELKKKILILKEQGLTELNTMINLGSEFYAQAKVKDTSKIFVNVGLGFFVEFTLDEALNFIQTKEFDLNQQADHYSNISHQIKVRIKMMYYAISQLLNLPTQETI